jgi:hypothetical protein
MNKAWRIPFLMKATSSSFTTKLFPYSARIIDDFDGAWGLFKS